MNEKRKLYWRKNLTYVTILLTIWFTVSCIFGILLADYLDSFGPVLGGFKLGFWFAQQGSEIIFVIEIFVYIWLMNRLDHEFDLHEE